MAELSAFDAALLDALQDGIAVEERPFAALAGTLGCSETEIVGRVEALLEAGVLSRFGPMFDAEKLGGAFSLCAMQVPESRLDAVVELVNGFPEVAHNYARRHRLNVWFVLASERSERLPEVVAEIEALTGLAVLDLPKLDEYYVGLKFRLSPEEIRP